MTSLRDVALIDLLPPNLTARTDLRVLAKVLRIPWRQMVDAIAAASVFTDVSELSDLALNALAYDLRAGYYDPTLPRGVREVLVQNAMPWHRTRGTKAAVDALVSAVFGFGQVSEWFEYGGQPYFFRVLTNNEQITGADVQRFMAALKSAQNARSWLEYVEIIQSAGSDTISLTSALRADTVSPLRLGAWVLGATPFSQIIDTEMIPIMTDLAYLQTAAQRVMNDIVQARVNGQTVITQFNDKQISGNEVTVIFTVSSSVTPQITQLEFLTANSTVVAGGIAAPIDIPAATVMMLSYTITVQG